MVNEPLTDGMLGGEVFELLVRLRVCHGDACHAPFSTKGLEMSVWRAFEGAWSERCTKGLEMSAWRAFEGACSERSEQVGRNERQTLI
jgi:hypothetical protein